MRTLCAFLCWAGAVAAAELPAKIQEALDAAKTLQRGYLGIQILDLKSGEVLFESNADRLFVPASNTKLFTTALGLERLGPNYRFRTTVAADAEPDADGRIAGAITLVGGGDPNLSGRELPYRVDSPGGDGLRAIEDLAAQVVARGVRRIDGDIVGDDTAYVHDPYPDGWGVGDGLWEYGAPVSALTVNDNGFILRVQPGDPARISIHPTLEFYQIDNQVRVGTTSRIRVEREPGSQLLRIRGTLPLKGIGSAHILAIHDPALYAATALRDALARRGVSIRGEAVARHAQPGQAIEPTTGIELARRDSARLLDILQVMSKVSQNLHAELILRAVAKARRGIGSADLGTEEMRTFLKAAGIPGDEYRLADGSGLSRNNLVTPNAVVKLLRFMYRSQQRENWLTLLPIGGEDGTLKRRLRDTAAAGRIRAKTGALAHVSSLSGYALRSDGNMLAFSFLSNNQSAASAEVRAVLDKICVLLTE